jgi:hypothetical protein
VLDLFRFADETAPRRLRWQPTLAWAAIVVAALGCSLYSIVVDGYEDFVYRFF